jgi:hypothetical protein
MRTLLVVFLFLTTVCQKPLNFNAVTGFWIPERMSWESPPSGLELDSLRFAYASTLYFSPDSTFKMFHWMLLKAESHDSLGASLGDGFSLHLGNWYPLNPNEILIRYRLVYRSITKVGEKLPTEEVSDTLAISDLRNGVFKLEMDKQTFVKSTMLTVKTRQTIEKFKGVQFH